MQNKYIMALDQGTTSSRCILFGRDSKIVWTSQEEFPQHFPKAGWVEHDALDIWESQIRVASQAMIRMGLKACDIAAIGITNQRETTICWNRETGIPVCPAIVWQCRRTADTIAVLKESPFGAVVREKTGLIPDAYFSASKLAWILENVEGVRELANRGEVLFGTVDTWLIWKLTGGRVHATDYTNASRTMMFNIHTLSWDEDILEYFHIPKAMLPEVFPSSHFFGVTDSCVGLPNGIPIMGAAGDQQAALFGQCCFHPGEMKNTYGTGCFLLMNTGHTPVISKNKLLTTIAASLDKNVSYALEGSVFVAGAAVQWLRDELGVITNASETEKLAESVPDTLGAYIVPAFTGLGAPYWQPYARGTITGITRGFGRAHLVRATLESIAYQVYDVVKAMQADCNDSAMSDYVTEWKMKVDGGASANRFLMQFQADIIDATVLRPKCIETTALGAAYLAGLCCGFWSGPEEIEKIWACDQTFVSTMGKDKREKLLDGWHKCVEKC